MCNLVLFAPDTNPLGSVKEAAHWSYFSFLKSVNINDGKDLYSEKPTALFFWNSRIAAVSTR